MIHFSIPWNNEKNIGRAYNETMRVVGENDWVCFIDGDSMFLDPFFGKKIQEVVDSNPEYGLFTCMTNRVGCKYQLSDFITWEQDDIRYHRRNAEFHWDKFGTSIQDISNVKRNKVLSGVMILISKKTWLKVGGFKENSMLGIDSDIHWRCMDNNINVGLMKGIYTYHWYRGGNRNDKRHLQ
jgi:GT2 family glycosyltransferase